MSTDAFPQEFDGYRLTRLIGEGGMGRVYLGVDTLLERPVAVKFLSVADPDQESRRRFLVEARAIARLQHPCIVAVYRVGEIDGLPYLVSEFVEGVPLDRLETPVPWQRALRIGVDIARGLAAAHRAGVVHRDIKPANAIEAADGTVKILDFGVARLLDHSVEPPERAGVSDGFPQETLAGAGAASGRSTAGAVEGLEPPRDDPGTPRPVPATAAVRTAPPVAGATVQVTLPDLLDEGPGLSSVAGMDPALQTAPGKALGTPAFMAPEAWMGFTADFASDVYSLGVLLYVLCVGRPPHEAGTLAELRDLAIGRDAEPLARVAPGVDPAFAAIVDHCLRRDPADRYPSAVEVRGALVRLTAPQPAVGLPEGNPYRGLRPFEAEHRAFYFGRDSEIRSLLEGLSTDPLVLVAGDSGLGKSSLCRAGVLPRAGEWLAGGRSWSVITMVPGRRPMAALAAGMAGCLGVPDEEWGAAQADGAHSFGRLLRRTLGSDRGLIVFVDQLEELVTLAEPAEAAAFSEVLGWITQPTPGVRTLATVRGDFLGRVAALPSIGDAIARSLFFLRPLSAERVRDAVTGPALALGVTFESEELVATLVRSTVQAEGGLPLLQFALERLWDARDVDRRIVTQASLEALGGVGGALGMHADDILARLRPRQRECARRMLLRLVTAGGTRSRSSPDDLAGGDPEAAATLDALVQGRLVVARETPEGPSCELAHEALLQGWGTLSQWLTVDAGTRIVRERIVAARAEWERLGRAREALWSGRLLDEAAAVNPSGLAPAEVEFLQASRRAQVRVRWVLSGVALAVVLALAATWGVVRVKAAMDVAAQVNRRIAAAAVAMDESRSLSGILERQEQQAFARFDRRERVAAEADWDQVQELRGRVAEALVRADRELEPAVALDPSRELVRARFADVLYERALLAEARHQDSALEELLSRLALYDAGGERMAGWAASGSVDLATVPPEAETTLERTLQDGIGRMSLEPVPAPREAPWERLSLAPGSYRVTVRAPGRAPVVLPFLVKRGGALQLDVTLPAEGDVPPGFVAVPAGRFLFGSAADDAQRRGFLHAVPLHEVSTGPFLIARHETTFADWIAFLEALPPAERGRRLPAVHAGGFEGALVFGALKDGAWQLEFKPSVRTWRVRTGEPLVYPGRERGAEQDWERFPVVGVSVEDATAYAVWLASTGRVRGARLCTDLEWERAARGADGRLWPHGNALAPDDANFDETYGKRPDSMGPDEVGSHPASRSPFGLDDMAGNVWEWTVSSVDPEGHAARGGSFYFDRNSARTEDRETPEPAFRDVSVGFRLCADLPAR
jgi:serine/threonine protein kinase/formylglycine-generating enzyme required for sulfatase activity